MGTRIQTCPNLQPPPPAPQARLQEGETHIFSNGNIAKPTQSFVCSSLEDVFLGCQGNSLSASSQMPAGSSLAPRFQEEKVINEKIFNNSAEFPPHEQSAVRRATVHPLFFGPTNTWQGGKSRAQLPAVESSGFSQLCFTWIPALPPHLYSRFHPPPPALPVQSLEAVNEWRSKSAALSGLCSKPHSSACTRLSSPGSDCTGLISESQSHRTVWEGT